MPNTPRRLFFNAFTSNMPTHSFHGLWRHPKSNQVNFASLDYWRTYAQIAERGKLDGIFLADVLGVGEDYEGGRDLTIRTAAQFPLHDPMVLMGALIESTEHIGLAFTSSIMQAHPFTFARQVSTLDHLSGGRIGWNIVTSSFDAAARNYGFETITPHDERYRWADEYMEVVYRLWEESWEDGALVHDAEANVFADPGKIHSIDHLGERYGVAGPHLVQPSPQRTPVLFQAGNSVAGRGFAARNAEVQFILPPTPQVAEEIIRDVRQKAAAAGRRPEDVRFVQALSFIVGSTEEEAQRRAGELDDYTDLEAMLSLLSREAGINFGEAELDTPLADVWSETENAHSLFRGVIDAAPRGTRPTIADLARFLARQNRLIGTPEQLADQLAEWQAVGVDGINVISYTMPGSLELFVDHVIPVLQERGLAQREYDTSRATFRDRLFGAGPHLNDRHPATAYRQRSSTGATA